MSDVSKVLDRIKDETLSEAKKEFRDYLVEAKDSGKKLAVDTAKKLSLWTVQLGEGEIGRRDFDRLVKARRATVMQWKNTEEIAALARSQKIILKAIDVALTKIAPALII